MPVLILLNGPPASGKSTLAKRLVERRPFALNLDIDVIRGQLGGWRDTPHEAGLAARALALAMITTHLEAGRDVIVPQFLARGDFIDQLAATATAADVNFLELTLDLPRQAAVEAFAARSSAPSEQPHVDAAALVAQAASADPVGEMHDALEVLLASRPTVIRVPVVRHDVDATLDALDAAICSAEVKR